LIARHGQESKNTHLVHGRNSRLDALQARVLSVKLTYLEGWIDAKNKHAEFYMENLKGVGDLKLPRANRPDERRSWHLFTIRTSQRDQLKSHLESNGIGCGIHYPVAPPLQPCYDELSYKPNDFPVAVKIQNETLSIPMYAELEQPEIEKVVKSIEQFFE
jgi:dTDP-4-amino-4,6-dideoxygalactose transaminase